MPASLHQCTYGAQYLPHLQSDLLSCSILPLYDGPRVRLQVSSSEPGYTVSENLLRKESPLLAAKLDEREPERTITLPQIEGVVSTQSVEALLQWVYLGGVVFDAHDPGDQIDAAIELARLADLCGVGALEDHMAEYIRNILSSNPHPEPTLYWRHKDTNTYCLASHQIISALYLPQGHSVRRVLAEACVEGYLRDRNHKFAEETQLYPSFGADLLAAVGVALDGLVSATNIAFEDPISKSMVEVRACQRPGRS